MRERPGFAERGRKKWNTRGLVFGGSVFAGFVCLVVLAYFLFFSKFFTIDMVTVQAKGDLDASQIRQVLFQEMGRTRLGIIPETNIFWFSLSRARATLQDTFAISQLTIKKNYPNRISVTVEGKKFHALWYSQGIFYDITPSGSLRAAVDRSSIATVPSGIGDATSTPLAQKKMPTPIMRDSGKIIPIIVDEKNQPIALGQTVVDQQYVDEIVTLPATLEQIGVPFSSIHMTQGAPDITIVTQEGWTIRFTLQEKFSDQLAYLDTVLREKIKGDRKKLNYVDVRFENRVYYTLH